MRVLAESPADALATSPPLSGLPRPLLEMLGRTTVIRHYAPGDHLWHTGDVVDSLLIVHSGAVAVVQHTAKGESIIMGLFGPGDFLCFSAALQRQPYSADAIAFSTPTSVLQVALLPIIESLPTTPELAVAINDALLEHSAVLRAKVNIVSAGSVPRRIAALMQHLIRRFGAEENPLEASINIPITREQIGQFVGARVETVIRILGRWQKAGLIRTSSSHIRILRRDMLDRIVAH